MEGKDEKHHKAIPFESLQVIKTGENQPLQEGMGNLVKAGRRMGI